MIHDLGRDLLSFGEVGFTVGMRTLVRSSQCLPCTVIATLRCGATLCYVTLLCDTFMRRAVAYTMPYQHGALGLEAGVLHVRLTLSARNVRTLNHIGLTCVGQYQNTQHQNENLM